MPVTRPPSAGHLPDGREVRAVTLESDGLRAVLWDHGARLHDLRLAGHAPSLVLGAEAPASYDALLSTFGGIIGPVANRISGARFEIDGEAHDVEAGTNGHCLHGESAGLHLKVWQIAEVAPDAVTFALDLAHGEGGFPGNRHIRARWSLEGTTLRLELSATTDRASPVNLAHHPYWTMHDPRTWAGQDLWIGAESYLPVDGETIPTGEVAPVAGTAFDFREARRLDPDALPPIDHNFCLSAGPRELTPALRLSSRETGVALEIATTAPGLQVFDMRPVAIESEPTLHGHPYPHGAALAVEPQMWPDAPGRPGWPDIVLRPGDTWRMVSEYRLSRSGQAG